MVAVIVVGYINGFCLLLSLPVLLDFSEELHSFFASCLIIAATAAAAALSFLARLCV